MSKVYSSDTKEFVNEPSKLNFTGKTEVLGKVRCAVMKDPGTNKLYFKPWDWIGFIRKPGEQNISSKLTNEQVKEIVNLAFTKTRKEMTFADMSAKYGVSSHTISRIANGNSWRHITRPLIKKLLGGNKEVINSCISASNANKKKNTKITASIAKFIVRDYMMHQIPLKDLVDKYCLSESSIRRIVSGKAWVKVTMPAIAEFFNWTKK